MSRIRFSKFAVTIVTLALMPYTVLAAETPAKFDYNWLLKMTGRDYAKGPNAPKFKAMINHISPTAKLSLYNGPAVNEQLNDVLFKEYSLAKPMAVVDNRYILLDGAQAHFATEEVFTWIDTKEDKSISLLSSGWWHGELDPEGNAWYLIISNSYPNVKSFPQEFWKAFAHWRGIHRSTVPDVRRFIGPNGKVVDSKDVFPGQ